MRFDGYCVMLTNQTHSTHLHTVFAMSDLIIKLKIFKNDFSTFYLISTGVIPVYHIFQVEKKIILFEMKSMIYL